jgi:hypothetical protein
MKTASPATSVLDEVTAWPGISTRTTSRGATAIVFERGHVHPNRATLDMPFSDDRRAEVLNAGRAKERFPGWVDKRLANDADAKDGIALLRQSYDELRALRDPQVDEACQ